GLQFWPGAGPDRGPGAVLHSDRVRDHESVAAAIAGAGGRSDLCRRAGVCQPLCAVPSHVVVAFGRNWVWKRKTDRRSVDRRWFNNFGQCPCPGAWEQQCPQTWPQPVECDGRASPTSGDTALVGAAESARGYLQAKAVTASDFVTALPKLAQG